MPQGLKPSSQQIEVSFSSLAAGGSYTSKRIDLQLNPLDQEVFVVTAVKLDLDPIRNTPINLVGVAGGNKLYGGDCALTRTESASALSNLGQNTCFATASSKLGTAEESQAGGDYGVAYSFNEDNSDTPSDLEYLTVIATNDFFVGLQAMPDGSATGNMEVFGKVYGYRATASASIYAALVQSEVISS